MISELDFSFNSDRNPQIAPADLPPGFTPTSYSLYITLTAEWTLTIGRLGRFTFPSGEYVYSGSAKKNILARVNRHLRPEKKLRWHIDYLLTAPGVRVNGLRLSTRDECELVRLSGGVSPAKGFGASDCRSGCGSHLRRLPAG